MAYCLVPYVLFAVPIALLSHGMTLRERGTYEALWSLLYLWIFVLLVVQMQVVHNYSFRRTVGMFLMTVFGVLVIGGSIVLVWMLSQQFLGFLGELLYEILRILL